MFFNIKCNTFFGLNLTLVYTFPMCRTWRFHFPLRNYDFKDEDGTIFTKSGKIKGMWKQNVDKLFNAENPREQLDELPTTEGPVECFSLDEIKRQIAKMGKGKTCGPDELPIEAVQIILEYKPKCIVEAFNNMLRTNKMPNDWRKSKMVPIFKGKGDALECNNYRGIKLMSHTMKIL